jgi:hypothetical protein
MNCTTAPASRVAASAMTAAVILAWVLMTPLSAQLSGE